MKYGNGAKVGNKVVFSPLGAVEAYRTYCDIFNREMSLEASAICSDAAEDMHRLGFSWEEIEKIELKEGTIE